MAPAGYSIAVCGVCASSEAGWSSVFYTCADAAGYVYLVSYDDSWVVLEWGETYRYGPAFNVEVSDSA